MNDSINSQTLPRRHWLTLPRASATAWLLLLLLALGVVIVSAFGEQGREWLRYQRNAIITGHQWWRLVTGHLVHGSWQHTWLNLAGLALMAALFHGCYSLRGWCVIGLCSMASIDVGLLLLMPQLDWYLGLSGVLHGVLAAGAMAWWRREPRPLATALSVLLLGKLSWEQWQGALPLSGELHVIVNAHLYGAVGGLLAALMLMRARTFTKQNQSSPL